MVTDAAATAAAVAARPPLPTRGSRAGAKRWPCRAACSEQDEATPLRASSTGYDQPPIAPAQQPSRLDPREMPRLAQRQVQLAQLLGGKASQLTQLRREGMLSDAEFVHAKQQALEQTGAAGAGPQRLDTQFPSPHHRAVMLGNAVRPAGRAAEETRYYRDSTPPRRFEELPPSPQGHSHVDQQQRLQDKPEPEPDFPSAANPGSLFTRRLGPAATPPDDEEAAPECRPHVVPSWLRSLRLEKPAAPIVAAGLDDMKLLSQVGKINQARTAFFEAVPVAPGNKDKFVQASEEMPVHSSRTVSNHLLGDSRDHMSHQQVKTEQAEELGLHSLADPKPKPKPAPLLGTPQLHPERYPGLHPKPEPEPQSEAKSEPERTQMEKVLVRRVKIKGNAACTLLTVMAVLLTAGESRAGARNSTNSGALRRLQVQAQTCSGNIRASDDVVCSRGSALIVDAATTVGSTLAACCTCAPGKSTVYDADALVFQFRADGITTASDLVWDAAVPSGLAFTTTPVDDPMLAAASPVSYAHQYIMDCTAPEPVATTSSVPAGVLFRILSTSDGAPSLANQAMFSNRKVALSSKHTLISVATPSNGLSPYSTILGFRIIDKVPGSFDGPMEMAELSAQLQDSGSSLMSMSGGMFPVQELAIIYMCPPGMVRFEGEAVCRKCPWPQFTPDRITVACEECCFCPAITVKAYADEAPAFCFRADGITQDADGSPVWNVASPSNLAFTMSNPTFWIALMVVVDLPLVAVFYACRNAYVERRRVQSGKMVDEYGHVDVIHPRCKFMSSRTSRTLWSVRLSAVVISLLFVLVSGATADTAISADHNITGNSITIWRRMQSCANVTCDPGQVHATNASACCTCPPGTVTNYADESLAFRFRADDITHDSNGSLVWNAAVPSGLAFTATQADCDITNARAFGVPSGQCDDSLRQGPTIVYSPEGLPSGLLFSYDPGPASLAENIFSTQSVAIGAKNTMFAVVTLAAGEMLQSETLLGFLDVEFAWYLGSLNAAEGEHGIVNADVWDASGFAGPAVRPEVMQLIISRSRYGTTTGGFDGPIAEMAVLDVSSPLDTIEWTSALYGSGVKSYNLATDQAFDLDFRDPDLNDGYEQNHAFAAGRMIIGCHAAGYKEVLQLSGTLHHLELHSDTLTNAQVAVVVRKLRHTVSPNSAPAVPACDDCEAGTHDGDSNPATACEPCEQGTFSDQSAVTQCAGTCNVGSTVLSTGATSSAACSLCAAGLYGSIRESVALCEKCEPGRFSTQVGARSSASCAVCPPGTFSAPGSTECFPSGCMDDWADNYNSAAEVDEGRCAYTCSRLRERGGTGPLVPGGCLVYETNGWQRYGHNNSAVAGGTFPMTGMFSQVPSHETWVMQGLAAPGSTNSTPMNIARYPSPILYEGGGNLTLRHILTPSYSRNDGSVRVYLDLKSTAGPASVTIAHVLPVSSRRLFLQAGVQARVSDSIIARSVSASSFGGAYIMGGGVMFLRVRFEDNEAVATGGGAGMIIDGTGTFASCTFTGNRAAKGAAMYVGDGSATVSNSLFRDNIATQTGGAIATQGDAVLAITLSEFLGNEAAGDGAALHTTNPLSLKIVDTTFDPFLDGAATVFIAGRLAACVEHPCDLGYACSYDKYSITCTPCEYPLVSADGLSCRSCLAGAGPNAGLTDCTECPGEQYSTFGVCLDPDRGYTSNGDHTAAIDVDECSADDGGCDPLAVKVGSCEYTADGTETDCQSPCKNEVGSFRCGPCPNGFLLNGDNRCVLPIVNNDTHANTGTVRPEAQIELARPNADFDSATQQQQLIDDAIIQLATVLQLGLTNFVVELADGSLRRLQDAAILLLLSIVSDDAAAKMAELSVHLQHANSTLVSGGLFPVQQLDITYMCPHGMVRPEGEAVCRKCLWPEFTSDRITCEECPVRQSPTPLGNDCQCADGYYSVEMEQLVCLDDEYDEEIIATANAVATLPGSEECRVCPTTRLGDPCAVCAAGTPPAVIPGFRERNELLPSRGHRRFAYRCGGSRVRQNVTAERCPASEHQDDLRVPHLCGHGYIGALCLSCIAEYHHVDDRCDECESRVANPTFWIVLLVVGGIPCFASCYACRNAYVEKKLVKSGGADDFEHEGGMAAYFCPGHIHQVRVALRSTFQPFRILVTYMQVTSQVGPVLRIKFPDVFEEIVEVLKSVNFWDHLFDAECEGLDDFTSMWVVRIIVLPSILIGFIFVYFMIERGLASTSNDKEKAATHFQSNVFMAVFFVYPPICNVVFATFNCRPLGSTSDAEVLMSDDRVWCGTSEHNALRVASFVVMLLFCFGLPMLFACILVKKAQDYHNFSARSDSVEQLVADRVAHDFETDVDTARYIIRDIGMSASFSFITDAYRPRFLYWETLDM
eukprot:COSAG06_NODE_1694_length_8699_cov_57.094767_1_plen_2376_part_10